MQDHRLRRTGPARLTLPVAVPVSIFANESVPIERGAVDELIGVLERHAAVIERAAVTPDFHKGAGNPIGTVLETRGVVLPQAIGNDINCGMRLHVTDLEASEVMSRLDAWETAARRLFFEGGRQIPSGAREREALLTGGLQALFENAPHERLGGLWSDVASQGWARSLDRVERRGSLPARLSPAFQDWARVRGIGHDDQTGSIGGGNHFVELQRVEKILDRRTAYDWGLRQGMVTVMVHSGSVGVGHMAGRWIRQSEPDEASLWDLLNGAANFAFVNRLFLAACAVKSLEQAVRPVRAPLLYDAPHNFVWPSRGGTHFVHRKGATPARGPLAMEGTPFALTGEPVLVPGSMGASSFVLAGEGLGDALESASHGAGRALSRGDASRRNEAEFEGFLREFRIVTPLDSRRPEVRRRADLLTRKIAELRAEGPHAYKGVHAIVETLATAGIARPVVELTPLATVKG